MDEAKFAEGQAADENYDLDTLFGYSKSGPKKDKYGSMVKVGTVNIQMLESTDEILTFDLTVQ